jgi:uncharacterized protein (TIGR02466 family)
MNDQLADELHRLRAAAEKPAAAGRAWQSAGNLHTLEAFQPFGRYVVAASRGVLEFLKCRYEGCEITNCWANVNRKGQAHRIHSHPNNFLSGVYYVRAPERCGDIVFHDPRQQSIVLLPQVTERTPFNAAKHSITPKEGTLLVFHSWFQHLVEPNESDQERISISFNVMLRGSVGYESGLAEF